MEKIYPALHRMERQAFVEEQLVQGELVQGAAAPLP